MRRLAEKAPDSPIWVEDESQRIGLVNIPTAFWTAMRKSPVYFLDIPFEERLKQIVLEYGRLDHETSNGCNYSDFTEIGQFERKNGHFFAKRG